MLFQSVLERQGGETPEEVKTCTAPDQCDQKYGDTELWYWRQNNLLSRVGLKCPCPRVEPRLFCFPLPRALYLWPDRRFATACPPVPLSAKQRTQVYISSAHSSHFFTMTIHFWWLFIIILEFPDFYRAHCRLAICHVQSLSLVVEGLWLSNNFRIYK